MSGRSHGDELSTCCLQGTNACAVVVKDVWDEAGVDAGAGAGVDEDPDEVPVPRAGTIAARERAKRRQWLTCIMTATTPGACQERGEGGRPL
jgi:hypothetical protein